MPWRSGRRRKERTRGGIGICPMVIARDRRPFTVGDPVGIALENEPTPAYIDIRIVGQSDLRADEPDTRAGVTSPIALESE